MISYGKWNNSDASAQITPEKDDNLVSYEQNKKKTLKSFWKSCMWWYWTKIQYSLSTAHSKTIDKKNTTFLYNTFHRIAVTSNFNWIKWCTNN